MCVKISMPREIGDWTGGKDEAEGEAEGETGPGKGDREDTGTGKGDKKEIVIAVLDIDCALENGFDEVDRLYLEKLAELIGRSCDW